MKSFARRPASLDSTSSDLRFWAYQTTKLVIIFNVLRLYEHLYNPCSGYRNFNHCNEHDVDYHHIIVITVIIINVLVTVILLIVDTFLTILLIIVYLYIHVSYTNPFLMLSFKLFSLL